MSKGWDPDYVVHPGATLREVMEADGLSSRVLAKACGHLPLEVFEGILDGTTKITPELAEKLEVGTRVRSLMWTNLERNFRAGLARGKSWDQSY